MKKISNIKKQPLHQIIYIDEKQRNLLKKTVAKERYPNSDEDYEEYVMNCHIAVLSVISKDLLRELMLMRNSPFCSGTILLKGLPLDDDLPPTPLSGRRSDYFKKTSIAETILIGLSSILGNPIGHEEEKDGNLIHDVIPVVGTDKPLSNEGAADFGLHVENAIFEEREQFLVLSCLRTDPWKEAATPVVDIREILPYLADEVILELQKEQFVIRKPYILDRASGKSSYSLPVAILTGPLEFPEVRCTFYEGGTKATSIAGEEALETFKITANKLAHDMKTEAGDMLIINNRTALHGRKAFRISTDGNNRHLLRVYIVQSLWKIREAQKNSIRILQRAIFLK